MGVQASAITHFGGIAVSTVVVTSTLARTADAAARPAVARPRKSRCRSSPRRALLALTWVGYLAGAVAGALLLVAMPYPLLVPVALLGLLLFL